MVIPPIFPQVPPQSSRPEMEFVESPRLQPAGQCWLPPPKGAQMGKNNNNTVPVGIKVGLDQLLHASVVD